MSVAKRLQSDQGQVFLFRGIMGAKAEKRRLDAYFASHPHLKKGQTIKSWILAAIASEDSGQAREMGEALGRTA